MSEPRIRTSLEPHLGRSSSGESDPITRLATNAYRQGRGVWLSAKDLEAMPWPERELILNQGRKKYRGKFGAER